MHLKEEARQRLYLLHHIQFREKGELCNPALHLFQLHP